MDSTTNSLNWFEIPVTDMARARKFYETIFDMKMEDPMEAMPGSEMSFFPLTPGSGKATGAILKGEGYVPSMEGTVVYLNANPNMNDLMTRVETAGGNVLVPKMSIGEHGNIAFISDTEGNKIGIHSNE
jgi:predicted enzyme related to lactoylglutathione lyase